MGHERRLWGESRPSPWASPGLPTRRTGHEPTPLARRLDQVAAAEAVRSVVGRVERIGDAPDGGKGRWPPRSPGAAADGHGGLRIGRRGQSFQHRRRPGRHDVEGRCDRCCDGGLRRLRQRRRRAPGREAVLPARGPNPTGRRHGVLSAAARWAGADMHDLDGPAAAGATRGDAAGLAAVRGGRLVLAEGGEDAIDLGRGTAGRHSAAARLAVALRGLADAAALRAATVLRARAGVLRISLAGGGVVAAPRGAAGGRKRGKTCQGVRCTFGTGSAGPMGAGSPWDGATRALDMVMTVVRCGHATARRSAQRNNRGWPHERPLRNKGLSLRVKSANPQGSETLGAFGEETGSRSAVAPSRSRRKTAKNMGL